MVDKERRQPDGRPNPEDLLARYGGGGPRRRGRHKIFVGFAAGVGKTYEMLNEAQRRKQRGQDVAIGFVETHGRAGTAEQIGDLEVVPRRKQQYRGATLEEMDTDAILARNPEVILVDELAHTNVPGSAREKRWQDVEVLLAAGITVLSTMNVQHMESLNDLVRDITGVTVRETVPDRVVRAADELKLVDITPRALIHRLERGDVYPPGRIEQARQNWFREGNLNALREIALREIAAEVDEDLEAYRRARRIDQPWAAHDRVMVCIGPGLFSLRLVRRGWRMAQRLRGDIAAVYVESGRPNPAAGRALQDVLALAERLAVPMVTLQGDVAKELVQYARENDVTQIVLGHSTRSRWRELFEGSIVNTLVRELHTVDILIVAGPRE